MVANYSVPNSIEILQNDDNYRNSLFTPLFPLTHRYVMGFISTPPSPIEPASHLFIIVLLLLSFPLLRCEQSSEQKRIGLRHKIEYYGDHE